MELVFDSKEIEILENGEIIYVENQTEKLKNKLESLKQKFHKSIDGIDSFRRIKIKNTKIFNKLKG